MEVRSSVSLCLAAWEEGADTLRRWCAGRPLALEFNGRWKDFSAGQGTAGAPTGPAADMMQDEAA